MPGGWLDSSEALGERGPQDRGPSLRAQGRVACGGLAPPDYRAEQRWPELRWCATCQGLTSQSVRQKVCMGGTFSCWARLRAGRLHLDFACLDCGEADVSNLP